MTNGHVQTPATSSENASKSEEQFDFDNLYLERGNGPAEGPGRLSIGDNNVEWIAHTGGAVWRVALADVNLHALSTGSDDDDSEHDGPYVLAQIGDDCAEVRLRGTDISALQRVYNAFCAGVERCAPSGEEEMDGGLFGGLGGLAALAGMVGGNGGVDDVQARVLEDVMEGGVDDEARFEDAEAEVEAEAKAEGGIDGVDRRFEDAEEGDEGGGRRDDDGVRNANSGDGVNVEGGTMTAAE